MPEKDRGRPTADQASDLMPPGHAACSRTAGRGVSSFGQTADQAGRRPRLAVSGRRRPPWYILRRGTKIGAAKVRKPAFIDPPAGAIARL